MSVPRALGALSAGAGTGADTEADTAGCILKRKGMVQRGLWDGMIRWW